MLGAGTTLVFDQRDPATAGGRAERAGMNMGHDLYLLFPSMSLSYSSGIEHLPEDAARPRAAIVREAVGVDKHLFEELVECFGHPELHTHSMEFVCPKGVIWRNLRTC